MMAAVSFSSPPFSSLKLPSSSSSLHLFSPLSTSQFPSALRASRRFPNNYPPPHDAPVVLFPDPRAWIGDFDTQNNDDDDEEEEQEEDEDDRSLDLLARFLHNVFRKVSRRARKSVRNVLPPSVSTKLVGFSVNGVLVLAFLWILKSLLEVVCTVGSMVFVSILLVRGVWSGVSYIKQQQYYNYVNRMNNDDSAWSGVRPAT